METAGRRREIGSVQVCKMRPPDCGARKRRIVLNRLKGLPALILLLSLISGCGYTNKIVLPYKDAKTIAVPMFRNAIPPESVFVYVAGIEAGITQAVSDGLARGGNLKLVDVEDADLELVGEIKRYEQEGFRFNVYKQVQQFRVFMTVNLRLEDRRTGKVIWEEKNFTGESEYFIDGPRAVTPEQAAEKVYTDLADRIVKRVVDEW